FQRQESTGRSRMSRSRSCSRPDAESLACPLSTVAPPSATSWYWLSPLSFDMVQTFQPGGTGCPGLAAEKTESCDAAPAVGATGPVLQPTASAAAETISRRSEFIACICEL